MTGGLRVPEDVWAEQVVVGCAVASRRGARLASDRLGAAGEPIYDRQRRRLYAAAVACGLDDPDERTEAVAKAAGVAVEAVAALVDGRPVQWDTSGGFARRVLDAGRRRSVMQAAASVFNALGEGATLAEIEPALAEMAAPA